MFDQERGFQRGEGRGFAIPLMPFLAHLSHRLRVSYCHWPVSVVRRATCVVRRQQFALNNISSETIRPRALIFGM